MLGVGDQSSSKTTMGSGAAASPRKGGGGRRRLFLCVCISLVAVLVTLGVLALIFYVVFSPYTIAVTAHSASIARFDLISSPTPNNNNSTTLAYDLTVALTVHNPNKLAGLYYDHVDSLAVFQFQRFYYMPSSQSQQPQPPQAQRFGYTQLGSFRQGTGASTQLRPIRFRGQQLLQADVVATEIRRQQAQDGSFAINVGLNAKLSVKLGAFKVKGGPKAKVSCNLYVPAPGSSTNNRFPFQPTYCKVSF